MASGDVQSAHYRSQVAGANVVKVCGRPASCPQSHFHSSLEFVKAGVARYYCNLGELYVLLCDVSMKRFTLSIGHKIVALNLSIIIFMSVLFALLSHWNSHSMFSRALNGIDADVLDKLAIDLQTHYAQHGDWQRLIDDQGQWGAVVNQHFFSVFFEKMAAAQARMSEQERAFATAEAPPGPPQANWDMPFGTFLQRLTLLDSERQTLIAAERQTPEHQMQRLSYQGQTIGWLSVGKINVDMLPLAGYFYQQQVSLIISGVLITALVAIILSVLLSWRMVRPIKKLVAITEAASKRQYEQRLDIKTGDELQQLAESINHLNAELERYDQRQKQWLMDISHELRTPLSILLIETSAICDKIAECDINAVAALRQDVLQIQRLVNDLHSLSELDEKGFTLQQAPFDLQQLVAAQVAHFEPQLQARGITVTQSLLSLPLLAGDAERLTQVLQNILSNCLKYTRENGRVWVTTERVDEQLLVRIEDDGPGVDATILKRLTDRLFRAESSRNNRTGGRGLGLSIASAIMQAHEGQLTCEASRYGGLCIQLSFPISMAI